MSINSHGDLPRNSANIHTIIRWEHANAAARASESVVSTDLGKVSHQTDDNTFYVLTATVPTWVSLGSGINNVVEDLTPQAGGEFDFLAHSAGFTLQTATGDGTTTIDWKLGNKFKFTFGAFNETFTFTAPSKPGAFQLILVQDSVGSRVATWPASVDWPAGTAPTLTTTATTGTDIVSFLYDGTTYYGAGSLDFS